VKRTIRDTWLYFFFAGIVFADFLNGLHEKMWVSRQNTVLILLFLFLLDKLLVHYLKTKNGSKA